MSRLRVSDGGRRSFSTNARAGSHVDAVARDLANEPTVPTVVEAIRRETVAIARRVAMADAKVARIRLEFDNAVAEVLRETQSDRDRLRALNKALELYGSDAEPIAVAAVKDPTTTPAAHPGRQIPRERVDTLILEIIEPTRNGKPMTIGQIANAMPSDIVDVYRGSSDSALYQRVLAAVARLERQEKLLWDRGARQVSLA